VQAVDLRDDHRLGVLPLRRVDRQAAGHLHMFTKPTGIFINPITCASTIAGTSRGRRQAPPHGAGPVVGV
jgi:hypothetical protein